MENEKAKASDALKEASWYLGAKALELARAYRVGRDASQLESELGWATMRVMCTARRARKVYQCSTDNALDRALYAAKFALRLADEVRRRSPLDDGPLAA